MIRKDVISEARKTTIRELEELEHETNALMKRIKEAKKAMETLSDEEFLKYDVDFDEGLNHIEVF